MIELTVHDITRIVIECAIVGCFGLYFNSLDRRRQKREQEREEERRESERQRIEHEQERYAREQERLARMALVEEALTAILRDRIIQSCRFFISKGNVSPFERENICRMYHAYHDGLGGNDIASDIYNKMLDLPIEM